MAKKTKAQEQSEAIEPKIEQLLSSAPSTLMQIMHRLELSGRKDDRAVNAALQRLRRRGRIKFEHGLGWVLLEHATCPTCKGKGYVLAT